jgi:hypothetical protein
MNNLELLQVYNFDNKKRYGATNDGGYVIAELNNEKYDCYISAGISNEESFSRDFIKAHNMNKSNSFGFDGTIRDYPWNYTKDITFFKKNINSFNDDKNTDLSFLLDKYNNIFLKMDIEGGEYPWLLNLDISKLKKIKQIVMEVHSITNNNITHYNNKVKCLEKLANTHYLVHAHGNNHGIVVNNIPDVIELTYVNKDYFKSIPEFNSTPLPIPNMDFPCNRNKKDINLTFYPFVKIIEKFQNNIDNLTETRLKSVYTINSDK